MFNACVCKFVNSCKFCLIFWEQFGVCAGGRPISQNFGLVKLPARARVRRIRKLALDAVSLSLYISARCSDTRIKGCEFILQNGEQYYYCLSPLLFDWCARCVSSPSLSLILIVSLRDRKPKFTYFAILNEYAARLRCGARSLAANFWCLKGLAGGGWASERRVGYYSCIFKEMQIRSARSQREQILEAFIIMLMCAPPPLFAYDV